MEGGVGGGGGQKAGRSENGSIVFEIIFRSREGIRSKDKHRISLIS